MKVLASFNTRQGDPFNGIDLVPHFVVRELTDQFGGKDLTTESDRIVINNHCSSISSEK